MICFYEKGIDVIKKSFAGALKGIICTPYYTERGLQLLDPFFDAAEEVEFWTRFSPLDWRSGVADMEALRHRVQSVMTRQKKFALHVSDDLHAKIYSFSNSKVIIGSANLTWPGMTTNIEIICELTKADAAGFLPFLSNFRSRLTPVPVDVFADYVTVAADAISKPFDGPVEEDGEMNAAIDLAEETLRKSLVKISPEFSCILPLEIEDFFEYCRGEKTGVSREITARIKGKHNLQGHVKHCFYGAIQFLSERPQVLAEIAATPGKSLYDFTNPSVRAAWRDFLHKHAREIDKKRDFSFRTLRVYLPPTLGGICTGGGGGSGTLKRVFPVVARMLQISGKNK
jgi:hypothetical protein